MTRHYARRPAKMSHRFIEFALFFQYATEVVTGDSVLRIDLNGRHELGIRFVNSAELVKSNAQIDMRFDPIGCDFNHPAIVLDRGRQTVFARFALDRSLKKLFWRPARHRMQPRGKGNGVKGEDPLLFEGAERAIGPRGNYKYIAALLKEAQFLQRQGIRAQLLLDKLYGAPHPPRGDSIFGQALEGAESDQIAESVKAFAPACPGTNQSQPLPIFQAGRVHSQDSSYFASRVSLRQAGGSARPSIYANDYPPDVKSAHDPVA